jgi:hypothetical protein
MDSTFAPQDTQCDNCCFRLDGYDCTLDKIKFYQNNGITVISTPNGNVLKDFICPYYRTKEWANTNDGVGEDLVGRIRVENAIPYLPILLFLDDELLINSLDKITKFETRPKHVYIIVKEDITAEKISMIKSVLDGTGIEWHVHVELEENSWHNIFKFYNRSEFLLLITGFPTVLNDWTLTLTKKIQDELFKFSYAENASKTMLLIPAYMYNSYYFEYAKNFINALKIERHTQACEL